MGTQSTQGWVRKVPTSVHPAYPQSRLERKKENSKESAGGIFKTWKDTPEASPGSAAGIEPPKRRKPRKVYHWTCQYCGQPFETVYYSQRYCNKTHKKYAQRERRNLDN